MYISLRHVFTAYPQSRIIATPGRLLHLIVEMNLDLKSVQYVVFDEADRLFEMGFDTALNEILHKLPTTRQTLLFSATLPKSLVDFAKAGLQDPKLVRLDVESKISQDLRMAFFSVKQAEKEACLLILLRDLIRVPMDGHERRIEESQQHSKAKGKGKATATEKHLSTGAPSSTESKKKKKRKLEEREDGAAVEKPEAKAKDDNSEDASSSKKKKKKKEHVRGDEGEEEKTKVASAPSKKRVPETVFDPSLSLGKDSKKSLASSKSISRKPEKSKANKSGVDNDAEEMKRFRDSRGTGPRKLYCFY